MFDTPQLPTPRTEDELAALRRMSTEHLEEGAPETFTCDDCGARYKCTFAFDWYNTDGDCIAEKVQTSKAE
jgi:hypothetical protein